MLEGLDITLSELQVLLDSGKTVEVLTEDGFHPVLAFLDMGKKDVYKLTLCNGLFTVLTLDHRVDTVDGWVRVSGLTLDTQIVTSRGLSSPHSLTYVGFREVCDIEVDHNNHRFFSQGISVHNCQANRSGYDEACSPKNQDHLYKMTAIGDYNSIERDSTHIISILQTPDMKAEGVAQLQHLKSRESALFPTHKVQFDGSSGWMRETASLDIDESTIVSAISELEL